MPFLNVTNFKILYGERTTTIAKHLEKRIIKKTKIEEHIKFLKSCKDQNLIPKGFVLKNNIKYYKNDLVLLNTMIKIRNNTLNWNYKKLRLQNIEINTQKTILSKYMICTQPKRNHEQDISWMNNSEIKTKTKIRKIHMTKLDSLTFNKNEKIKIKYNNNNNYEHHDKNYNKNNKDNNKLNFSNVVNLSSKTFNVEQIKIMEKGLNFIPTPTRLNFIEYYNKHRKLIN